MKLSSSASNVGWRKQSSAAQRGGEWRKKALRSECGRTSLKEIAENREAPSCRRAAGEEEEEEVSDGKGFARLSRIENLI